MDKFGNFQDLINKGKDQVFLFTCPGPVPFNLFFHTWFVLNKEGTVSRWEVVHRETKSGTSWGHLNKDFLPPFSGLEKFFFSKKMWDPQLLGRAEGETAKRVIDFIENSPRSYPYREKYHLTGPNCNTFIQWVLDKFPEFDVKLPRKSVGKGYKGLNRNV